MMGSSSMPSDPVLPGMLEPWRCQRPAVRRLTLGARLGGQWLQLLRWHAPCDAYPLMPRGSQFKPTPTLTVPTLMVMALGLVGCGPSHIRPYTERNRQYSAGSYERTPQAVSEGSLWLDASRGLFADFRANRVGDILTVRIDENPRATGDANTQMDRETSMNWGVNNLFGLTAAITEAYPDIDPTQLLNVVSSYEFSGQGQTSRSSNVRAEIAVRVKQQLPERRPVHRRHQDPDGQRRRASRVHLRCHSA